MRSWPQRVAVTLLPTVALLAVGEAGARAAYSFQHGDARYLIAPWGGRQLPVVYPLHPRETYVQVDSCSGREITFTVNRAGGRGKEWSVQKPPGAVRIASIGGSSTFGITNPDDQTWPAHLERILQGTLPGPVEVLNAGLPGYGLKDFNEFVSKGLAPYSPEQVIYYEGWNDTDLPLASQVHHNIRRFHGEGLFGWLSGLLYRRSILYTTLLEKTQFMLVSRRSGMVPDVRQFEFQMREFIRRVRQAKAVPVVVLQVLEASGQPAVAELRGRLARADLHDRAEMERLIRESVPRIRLRDGDPVSRLRVAQTEVLLEAVRRIGRKDGVPVLDPLPAFLERPRPEQLFCDVVHLTDEGNHLLAEQIAGGILDDGARIYPGTAKGR